MQSYLWLGWDSVSLLLVEDGQAVLKRPRYAIRVHDVAVVIQSGARERRLLWATNQTLMLENSFKIEL